MCFLFYSVFQIGGYESDFLAELVLSYRFDKSKDILNLTIYHGIYRDDGLLMFKGKKSVKEIKYWLEEFQKTVNMAEGNQYLQFTEEIWKTDVNPPLPVK